MIRIELSIFNNIIFTVVLSRFIWLYVAETSSLLWILMNTSRVRWLIVGVCIYTYNLNCMNHIKSRFIPRSYVAGGSETGVVSRDDAIRERFSHRRNVKMGKMVLDNIFWPKEKYIRIRESFKNIKSSEQMTIEGEGTWTVGDHLDHHQCPAMQVAIEGSLKMTWRSQALKSGETKASCSPSEFPHS